MQKSKIKFYKKCTLCHVMFWINEYGQGTRKYCYDHSNIVRKARQRIYSRRCYLNKLFKQVG